MTERSRARRHRGKQSKMPRTWIRDASATPPKPWSPAMFGDAAADTYRYWSQQSVERLAYVYFAQELGEFAQENPHGPIKIGTAANPITRLAELQCGNPRDLYIPQLILGTKETEKEMHYHWRSALIRGEWFGNGRQADILAAADWISKQQIRAHRCGDHHAFLAAISPKTIWPAA